MGERERTRIRSTYSQVRYTCTFYYFACPTPPISKCLQVDCRLVNACGELHYRLNQFLYFALFRNNSKTMYLLPMLLFQNNTMGHDNIDLECSPLCVYKPTINQKTVTNSRFGTGYKLLCIFNFHFYGLNEISSRYLHKPDMDCG